MESIFILRSVNIHGFRCRDMNAFACGCCPAGWGAVDLCYFLKLDRFGEGLGDSAALSQVHPHNEDEMGAELQPVQGFSPSAIQAVWGLNEGPAEPWAGCPDRRPVALRVSSPGLELCEGSAGLAHWRLYPLRAKL